MPGWRPPVFGDGAALSSSLLRQKVGISPADSFTTATRFMRSASCDCCCRQHPRLSGHSVPKARCPLSGSDPTDRPQTQQAVYEFSKHSANAVPAAQSYRICTQLPKRDAGSGPDNVRGNPANSPGGVATATQEPPSPSRSVPMEQRTGARAPYHAGICQPRPSMYGVV
jgi:hypothetical protein